ncbi:hypothetical protein JCM14036_33860 [Desulfotomaculum defluvii]
MYRVNLLPPYLEPQNPKDYRRKLGLILLVSLLFLLLFLSYGIFYTKLTLLHRQVEQQTKLLVQQRDKSKRIENLMVLNKMKQEQLVALSGIASNRLQWYDLLQDLPLALPMDTWVTGIEIKRVEGISTAGGFVSSVLGPHNGIAQENLKTKTSETINNIPQSPPVPNILYIYGACWAIGSVGVLVDNLSKLPYFHNVKLVEAKYDREKGMIKFELVAKIKIPQS